MSCCVKVGDTPADMAEGVNAGMVTIGVSETGNEVGLSEEAFAALPEGEGSKRVAVAAQRLTAAGANFVLRSVVELPAWLYRRQSK
jgi:phosphonoacetaldehyde hydrolase